MQSGHIADDNHKATNDESLTIAENSARNLDDSSSGEGRAVNADEPPGHEGFPVGRS